MSRLASLHRLCWRRCGLETRESMNVKRLNLVLYAWIAALGASGCTVDADVKGPTASDVAEHVDDDVAEAGTADAEGEDVTVADVGDAVADVGDAVTDVGDTVADVGDAVADVGDAVADVGDAVDVADLANVTDASDTEVQDAPTDTEFVEAPPALSFTRHPVPVFDAHDVATEGVPWNGFAYGYGVAPLDADGDGDLDMFVGSVPGSTVSACIYENVSVPGDIVFSRRDAWCAPSELSIIVATGLDVDLDGVHELVAASESQVYRFRASEGWLLDSPATLETSCIAGPLAAVDEDWNGTPEVVVSCMPDNRRPGGVSGGPSRTFSIDVTTLALTRIWRPIFNLNENVLGLGIVDVNNDGLLDLTSIVDTFGSPVAFNPDVTPSGVLQRCPPTDECNATRIPIGIGPLAWGSHMGFEVLTDLEGRDIYWLADRDEPRPVYYADGQFVSAPVECSHMPFGGEDGWLNSWGLVASDWNGDGYPDLFVSSGRASPSIVEHETHDDGVLLGEPSDSVLGWRLSHNVELSAGLESHDDYIDPTHSTTRASRTALQIDFDFDGRPEVFVAAANGPPFVYQVEGSTPRCTLRVQPNSVNSWGAGYRVRRPNGVWEAGPSHGEVLSTDAPWLITEHLQGRVRFPSGAEADYDCGDAFVVDVREPDWLSADVSASRLTVRIAAEHWLAGVPEVVDAWVAGEEMGQLLSLTSDAGVWSVELPAGATTALLRIDGRWLARDVPL
ncbi:MAG: hypothetical protein ACJA1R_002269 [Flavobacteriales bacterium]|jgi:hypothetical protein